MYHLGRKRKLNSKHLIKIEILFTNNKDGSPSVSRDGYDMTEVPILALSRHTTRSVAEYRKVLLSQIPEIHHE